MGSMNIARAQYRVSAQQGVTMRCLLVDKIIDWENGKHITGIKNVTMSENFLQDHFPGFPVMPGVLQLETVLQLASWLFFASTGYRKKAGLLSIKSIKFKKFVVPGDQMRVELNLKEFTETQAIFDAKIFVDSELKTDIRRGTLSFVDVAAIEDPVKARAHFDFITGNAPMGGYGYSKNS